LGLAQISSAGILQRYPVLARGDLGRIAL